MWETLLRETARTHYWALRQQARGPAALVAGAGSWLPGVCGGLGVLVVAPLWWWGVVFDLWIVVASIEMMACVKACLSFVGVGVFVWVVVSCNANFSDTCMQVCLSGWGVCG